MVEAASLLAHPLSEPGDRLWVVARALHCLRQEEYAAHRGLELVADVGEEVAPHLFYEVGVRTVLDEEQNVLITEPGRSRADDAAGIDTGSTREGELLLHHAAFGLGPTGQRQQRGIGQGGAADEPVRDSRGRARHNIGPKVQDDPA